MRSFVRLALSISAVAVLAACATTPPPPPPPPPPAGPSAGGAGTGATLMDWRGVITSGDRDRYVRRDAAWSLALQQARRQKGSGDLNSLGDLIDPGAARPGAAPRPGNYRCRTVKLGSQGGEAGLGYVVYGWFGCRIEQTPRGLKFTKTTGSQRFQGRLYPDADSRLVYVGTQAWGDERGFPAYGAQPERDQAGVVERIGENRWRVVIPWPKQESKLDLIEIVR